MFNIKDKVALITGGASGIGLQYAKELLREGLKACTLADINEEFGKQAVKEIKEEFGENRVVFVRTDVTDKSQLEEAFRTTVKEFKYIDILINNAGIFNDFQWEKEILININGTVHGCLLGLEDYLPKYRSGNEAVIVNVSSICGLDVYGYAPVYTSTKHAIIGLSRSFALSSSYKGIQIKVLTICPGLTDTPLINYDKTELKCLSPIYAEFAQRETENLRQQSPVFVAQCMIRIIREGKNGSVWLVEHEEPPCEMTFTNRIERKEKSEKNIKF